MKRFRISKLLIYFAVAAVAIFCALPLWDLLMRSVTPLDELLTHPAGSFLLLPRGRANLEGYVCVFRDAAYLRNYGRGLGVTLLKTLLQLTVVICGAYAGSRRNLLWRRAILWFVLIPVVFPMHISLQIQFLHSVGLKYTLASALLSTTPPVFFLLMMRAAFERVPREMQEAARLEGAGPLRQTVQVLLPAVRPYLAALVLLNFTGCWNDFLPLWLASSSAGKMFTPQIFTPGFEFYTPGFSSPVYAAYVLMTLPPLALLAALNRWLRLDGDAPRGIVLGTLRDDCPSRPEALPAEPEPKQTKRPHAKRRRRGLRLAALALALALLIWLALPSLDVKRNCEEAFHSGGFPFTDPSSIKSGKPVIYLYPEEPTEVTVTLGHPERLTVTYPAYEDSWTVTAEPDGTLHGKNRDYYALYWEGTNSVPFDRSEGFCFKGSDSAAFLEEKLALLGLSDREAEEFIIYWLPMLQQSPWVLVRFRSMAEIEADMPLTVSPAPDSILRVSMELTLLDAPVEVHPQVLVALERNGFTVVEWGVVTIENKQ